MLTVRLSDLPLEPEWGVTDQSIRLDGVTASSPENGARDSIVIYFTLDAGKRTGRHTDSAEEIVYVVEGLVEARVGDERAELEPGSYVVIPRNVPHDIVNAGDTPVKAMGYFGAPKVDSVFEQVLLPRNTDTFSLP